MVTAHKQCRARSIPREGRIKGDGWWIATRQKNWITCTVGRRTGRRAAADRTHCLPPACPFVWTTVSGLKKKTALLFRNIYQVCSEFNWHIHCAHLRPLLSAVRLHSCNSQRRTSIVRSPSPRIEQTLRPIHAIHESIHFNW